MQRVVVHFNGCYCEVAFLIASSRLCRAKVSLKLAFDKVRPFLNSGTEFFDKFDYKLISIRIPPAPKHVGAL